MLTLDGRRVPLDVVDHDVATRPGAGGLSTLRLDVVYRAVGNGRRSAFDDRSFPDRIGWREVTLEARDGGRIITTDVPRRSTSDGLHAYPSDLLRSPLDVTSAHATVALGSASAPAPTIGDTAVPRACGRRFRVAHRAR